MSGATSRSGGNLIEGFAKSSRRLAGSAAVTVIVAGLFGGLSAARAEPGDLTHFGWDFSAEATVGSRYYFDANPYPDWAYNLIPGLNGDQFFPFIQGKVKVSHTSADGHQRFTLEADGRYDFSNDRGFIDLSEANFFYDGGTFNVLAGVHTEVWGVTESRHLVDIINPIRYDGDPLSDERLGQPMLNVSKTGSWGTLSLYGLFGFRQPNFRDISDRFPFGWIVNDDDAHYEDGDWHNLSFAARYSHTVAVASGSLDYAVSLFTGTARNPRLVPEFNIFAHPPLFLAPYYDHITQVGTEFLYTYQALQLKFEGIYRRQNGEDIWAATGGFEYTLNGLINPNLDVGLIAEYSYDSRDNNDWNWHSGFSMDDIVNNAVFGGVRFGLNNAYNTSLLAGVYFDVNDSAKVYMFDLSSRVTDNTKVSFKGRFFEDIPKDNIYYLYNKEDYLELSLTRFF